VKVNIFTISMIMMLETERGLHLINEKKKENMHYSRG
jgi:hypothetical protein